MGCVSSIKCVFAVALVGAGWAGQVVAADLAQQVVIVYNEKEPSSRPLADYYAQRRGVPTNQICAIRARISETITRKEFENDIREPLLRFLSRNGLIAQQPRTIFDSVLGKLPWLETVGSKISYIVLMRGVPLRIDSDPSLVESVPEDTRQEFRRNEASVETELAVVPTIGVMVTGFVSNPFFKSLAEHFGPPLNQRMFLVGRLDGPDEATVRRMINDALTAEKYGLHGRAYFDAQGTKDKGYTEGDDWIRASYRLFREAGYECDYDEKIPIFDEDYPMSDVAIYAGWYAQNVSGPFRREDFHFKTGAVAYHIHSSSGASVQSRTSYWVGPFLAKGAAATMGNVFEPYLSLTPHVDIFFKRLLDGGIFLEAGYASQPVLSWQTTFAGDPLYRPYAATLDEQIARLEADKLPDLEWAYVRKINLLVAASKLADAETLCRAKAESLSSAALYEKLGDLLRVTHRQDDAIDAYKTAMQSRRNSHQSIRLATKLADAYEANAQKPLAMAVYEGLAAAYATNKIAIEFYGKARDLAAGLGEDAKVKKFQAKIDALTSAEQAAQNERK